MYDFAGATPTSWSIMKEASVTPSIKTIFCEIACTYSRASFEKCDVVMKMPLLGEVPGAFSSTAWDFELHHLTNATTQGKQGSDVLVDDAVPPEYRNFTRYSTLAGLAQIMK